MTLTAEIKSLRQELKLLSRRVDSGLIGRYALRLPPAGRVSLYRRLRMAVGWTLRRLGVRPTRQLEPWLPGLKHLEAGDNPKPLVIWAVGVEQGTLRDACRGFQKLVPTLSNFVPVLVTDVADFAFFSRLGWLVEYVPELSAPAAGYAERKCCYLAWRYRDALALPVSVGIATDVRVEELMID